MELDPSRFELRYYTTSDAKILVMDRLGQLQDSISGDVYYLSPVHEYPGYVLFYNDDGFDVIEHRKMEPRFYIVTDAMRAEAEPIYIRLIERERSRLKSIWGLALILGIIFFSMYWWRYQRTRDA